MIRKDTDGLRLAAWKNVLTTEETCSILNKSRQQLYNHVKAGDIEVFKVTSNGNLFWRPDVYELMAKIRREHVRQPHKIYGGGTSKAIEAFQELAEQIDMEQVSEVMVFFNPKDAIAKDFFNIEGAEVPDTLIPLESARFIIVMEDGEEYWMEGLTCGYYGAGSKKTVAILNELGIDKSVPSLEKVIYDHKYVHLWKEEDGWDYCTEGQQDDEMSSWKEYDDISIKADFYLFNGSLVLTQAIRYGNMFGGTESLAKEILFKSSSFIPEPTYIELLSKDDALDTGHFQMICGDTIVYQVIIRDVSGKELWLNIPLDGMDTIMFSKKPHNMQDLFKNLGIEVEGEPKSLPRRMFDWLQKKPRFSYGKYKIKHDKDRAAYAYYVK